jgi:Family of unknown function (DUF5343)
MPVTEDRPAPYAPPSAIIEIVSRYRSRGLMFPISAEVLARIGISESLIPRTLQSLQTLDLFNDAGNPTETLEGIRLAPEAEYKKRLADWLKSAYAGIFVIVDPTKDGSVRIRDAFRGYNPVGQQERMVTLFEGLCAEAGLVPEKPSAKKVAIIRSSSKASVPVRLKAKPKISGALPPAIAGLLESLPASSDGWTDADRAKFLKTFESVLDFSIPIIKEKKETAAR